MMTQPALTLKGGRIRTACLIHRMYNISNEFEFNLGVVHKQRHVRKGVKNFVTAVLRPQ
jgi:hypothetical protein